MWSPTTPLDNIKNWYVIQPTTIIPSKIDLAEITDWRKIWSSFTWIAPEWWFISWEITYNYPNVFIESPKNPCEGRWIQEDSEIIVDIISPIENSTVSDKFALRYAINAERWVRSVVVFSDWEQIANFSYNGKDTMVNEQSAVFSKLSAWKHNIEVIVDRLVVKPEITSRLSDSIETASKLSNGVILVNIVKLVNKKK